MIGDAQISEVCKQISKACDGIGKARAWIHKRMCTDLQTDPPWTKMTTFTVSMRSLQGRAGGGVD